MKRLVQLSVFKKFFPIIFLGTAAILATIAAGTITSTGRTSNQQTATFIEQLRAEEGREEKLLRDGLVAKGNLLVGLLADSAGEPMLNYDYEPLGPLARNAAKDPDIAFVTFFDDTGKAITPHTEQTADIQVLQRNIVLAEEQLGSVSVGLDFITAEKSIAHLSKRIDTLIESTERKKEEATQVLVKRIIVFSAIGLTLLSLLIYVLFFRVIVRPLRLSMRFAGMIRNGNLGQRLDIHSNDELGQLAEALDQMAEKLEAKTKLANDIADGDLRTEVTLSSEDDLFGKSLQKMLASIGSVVCQIQLTTDQIAASSVKVSDSSQSLSLGASEQATSLEQITSSMSEMASQTKRNAEHADQANQLAIRAQETAKQGDTQMNNMIEAMAEINDASQDISKIISTIDEIASQTNMLALNAAIEAARAGQHGKGFAVVAAEVRKLAGKSADAAREIAAMIEDSLAKVENGTQLANNTGEALREIVIGNSKVTELVTEIAAASSEQAEGISQVNQGLFRIDQVTQQNSANADEGATAAEKLSAQADQLRTMMTHFKHKESESHQGTQEAPPAPKETRLIAVA